MQVFKIYDDEWSQIAGENQLKEFALYQLGMCFPSEEDEELQYNIKTFIDEDRQSTITELITEFYSNPNNRLFLNTEFAHKLSIQEAKELLQLRCFDVEEIEIW